MSQKLPFPRQFLSIIHHVHFNVMDTLVKALKASGGPSKLTVAADAWRDSSFHAPNKAEIIVEWILLTFKQHPYGRLFVFSATSDCLQVVNSRSWLLEPPLGHHLITRSTTDQPSYQRLAGKSAESRLGSSASAYSPQNLCCARFRLPHCFFMLRRHLALVSPQNSH